MVTFSAVKAMEEFIRKRWVRIGTGGIEGLARAAGMGKQTVYSLVQSSNPSKHGELETRERLALVLRFRDWNDLIACFLDGDFYRGLAWVKITPIGYELAKREADRRGISVEQWVDEAVVATAKILEKDPDRSDRK